MSSVVNHAIIEGMVTMTLGYKPRVLWQSASIDVQHVVNSLTRTAVHLPEVPDDVEDLVLEQHLGIGLLCVQAHATAKQALWPQSGLQREAVSALEVGMASKALMARAPFLRSKVQALADALQDEPMADAKADVQSLHMFVTTALRVGLADGQAAQQSGAQTTVADRLAGELRECEGTEDYVTLVQRWLPEASQATMEPPNDPEDGEQGQAHDSEDGGDSSSAAGEGKATQGRASGQQPSQPDEKSDEGSGAEASQGAKAAGEPGQAGETGNEPGNTGACDTPAGEALADSEEGQGEQTQETAAEAKVDQDDEPGQEPAAKVVSRKPDDQEVSGQELLVALGTEGGDGAGAELKPAATSKLSGIDGRLMSTLLRVLQGRAKPPRGLKHSGPRVEASRFWRLRRLGDTQVFRNKQEREGISIAIQILMDVSDSMTINGRFEAAMEVTLALSTALTRMTGVQCAVDVFPAPQRVGTAAWNVLPFTGQIVKARAALARIYPEGGTPLLGALRQVLPALLGRQTERKAILVLTDGEPMSKTQVIQEIAAITEMGVEVYGIGINIDVEHLIKNSVAVYRLADLPKAVETIFKKLVNQKVLVA